MKNKLIKIKKTIFGFVMFCETIFKLFIFCLLGYMIGFVIGYSQTTPPFIFDVFHTFFIIGGMYWILKDYIKIFISMVTKK